MFVRFYPAAVVAAAILVLSGFAGAAPKVTQAQVARKGAFPVVRVGEASLKTAIAATNLAKAKTKLNSSSTFSGVVSDVYLPKNGKRVLLDFAPDYKKAVVGQVDASNFKLFPDLRSLKKKRVLVSGRVSSYKGQIQVELVSPLAIRVVK